VLKYYPAVKIIQPELRDVIVNTVQALLSAGRTEVKTYGVDGHPKSWSWSGSERSVGSMTRPTSLGGSKASQDQGFAQHGFNFNSTITWIVEASPAMTLSDAAAPLQLPRLVDPTANDTTVLNCIDKFRNKIYSFPVSRFIA
jgi:hypothetical protein